MGEISFVGTSETRGYPYLVCKKCCYLSMLATAVFIAAVSCVILERTSDFEPLSETIALRYLKLVTVSNFWPSILISLARAVCHKFGLLITYLHSVHFASFVETFN